MFQLKSLQIELTSRCNERCVHCYIPHEYKNQDMDSALLFSILDQCRDMDLKQITFSGGEPMLHPEFINAIEKADWHGFKIRVFSNLTLLDDRIVAQLKRCNVYEVQASLYSIEPGIHDSITKKPGSSELTKAGIQKLLDTGIRVFISCPIMKQNKDSYSGVLDYAKNLGANSAPDNMIFAQSNGGSKNLENRLSINEALEVIQSILENDTAYNHERFMLGYNNQEEALPCVQNVCKDSLCVNAKGEVLPTPGWNYVLGDLNTHLLKDLWENSAETKKIRALTLADFPQCEHCPDIQFCGMSLEGNANENPQGNPLIIPPHVCELARRTRLMVHDWHTKRGTYARNQ
jgi:radical SAM protein with 4Fe4S-binding SPASM domain